VSVDTRKRTQLHWRTLLRPSSSWIMSNDPNLQRTCGTVTRGYRLECLSLSLEADACAVGPNRQSYSLSSAIAQLPTLLPENAHDSPASEAFSIKTKQTPWPLVRKRTIPTERPPLLGEILVPTFADRGVSCGQRGGSHTVVNLSFLDRSRYFFFQVAPHLSSRGLSAPRSRLTATQKIWQRRESNPGPLGLQAGSVTTRAQRLWQQ
jgi:hypothetical protein